MKRGSLIKLLEDYRLRWLDEWETCEQFIAFVATHPNCFERTCIHGHVTGSAWLVNGSGTQALLTHHRKLGQWFQLGGHADGETNIGEVALREAREESGLADLQLVSEEIFDIDIHRIPARGDEPEHDHYDARFLVQSTGSEQFSVGFESLNLAWVAIDRLNRYTREESMLRMAAKWRKRHESA